MQTYTFGQCAHLLTMDPKVFRELVKKELGLQQGEQVSRADRRARYLTREQLERLAALRGITLPDDHTLGQPEQRIPVASHKLLLDRLEAVEEALHADEQTLSSLQERLIQVEQQVATVTSCSPLLERLPTWMAQVDERLERQAHSQEQPGQRLAELEAQHRREIAEVEARYQRQITELEAQLARYRTGKHSPSPPATAATKQAKTRSKAKKLPKTWASRRAFAALHDIPDSLVVKACNTGAIAATSGKWLYKSRIIFQALGPRGQADFYQIFHTRPGFTRCNQCPHDFTQE
jgi:DNA repair exonuclease SbcCD ATPase subunit